MTRNFNISWPAHAHPSMWSEYLTHVSENLTSSSPGILSVPGLNRSTSIHRLWSCSRPMWAFSVASRLIGSVSFSIKLTTCRLSSATLSWICKENLKALKRQCPSLGTWNALYSLSASLRGAWARFKRNRETTRNVDTSNCESSVAFFGWFLSCDLDCNWIFGLETFDFDGWDVFCFVWDPCWRKGQLDLAWRCFLHAI